VLRATALLGTISERVRWRARRYWAKGVTGRKCFRECSRRIRMTLLPSRFVIAPGAKQ
jgi:hypothetical protein